MVFTERDEREFREAAGLHQAGNLPEAVRAYQKLLKRSPKQAIIHNLLGLAEFQAGHLEAAAEALRKALALNPAIPDIHYNLATVLHRIGRFEESIPHFEKALAAKPDDADARNNFGTALRSLGRDGDAVREYEKALTLDSNHAGAHLNLGNALSAQQREAEAVAHIEKSIALQPRNPDAYVSLGNALMAMKRGEEAISHFAKAIALNPQAPEPYFFQGQALNKTRKFDEAAGHFLKATQLKPDFTESYIELGTALQGLGRYEESLEFYQKAVALDPQHAEANYNLGNALQTLERYEESMEPLQKALALKPGMAMALMKIANVVFYRNQYEEARALYEKSLAIEPDNAGTLINYANLLAAMEFEDEALQNLQKALAIDSDDEGVKSWNMGYFCLGLGRWQPGWELHENRFKRVSKPINYRDYPVPRWDGKKLKGALLVWGEQGLGDQILFGGMLPELRALADRVIVECEPRLVPLFARSIPGIDFISLDDEKLFTGQIGAHVPIASLGKFFRPTWESFPRFEDGYLRADEALTKKLRGKITAGSPAAIGLSWRSVNPFFGEAKSAKLRDYESILRIANCAFVDLQYGDTHEEREEVGTQLGIDVAPVNEIDKTQNIDGLAALISACDAVVTTSNTTAHLAGALGKHTWVLVPFGRGRLWYWFKQRADSPWYPDMHLVRQARDEPWSSVAKRAASEVAAFLSRC